MSQTFAEYLAGYRALAPTGFNGDDSPTDADVLALLQTEYIAGHEISVVYEYLGDDSAGYPVWRLGRTIVLQDLQTNLDALVAAGSASKVPGAKHAYSLNPSLRK